jgi:2-polyprenyl-3-methyl-5-hydroxy-6-metoxy-1,4-benzoquinol methylase
MNSKNNTEKFWDRMAEKHDKQAKIFESLPVEETKKYLKSSDTVLDFGCATGTMLIEIADCVKEAVGIDISSKMIEIAKRKTSEFEIGNIDFRQATIFDKSLENESFNAIIAFNIIHYIENTQELVQRMYELLKPNGLVIINTAFLGQKTLFDILFKLILLMSRLKIMPYMKISKIDDFKEIFNKEGFDFITVENFKNADYFIVAKKKEKNAGR